MEMSGLGTKRVSKWDPKEDTHPHHRSSINETSGGAYYRDKEPETVRFNAESNGEARTSRSRVSHNNDKSYYSEHDEARQQFFHRSGSRSNSRSSRSRSRSPVYRARRDAGAYDSHKTRTKEFNKRSSDHHQFDQNGWEDKLRKPRETKYHTDDFREQSMMMMKGVRSSSDYDDNSRRHTSEMREGEFHRSSNIPCKFFASGFCRNGKGCKFSHHIHGGVDRKQLQENNFYRQENNNNHNKWNVVERCDNGRRLGESKGNGSSWIDDMEMSPDWNYGVQSLKNPVKEELIGQSSQSRVLEDGLVTNYDQRSSDKTIAGLHQKYSNSVNIAQVQEFNQNHQNVLPYQSSLTSGGRQQVLAAHAVADFSLGSNLSNLESGKVYQNSTVEKPVLVQNTVSKEQIEKITTISATIAQLLANRQAISQLNHALLHSESSVAVQPNLATTALHTQSNSMTSNPPVQLVGLGMMSNGAEETAVKKTDEASKEDTNDAENIVDEDNDDGSDEENKKGKEESKGMRAFKFALVEVVKELLKPAWKEGKMNKDGYKNIVKKVVEKVMTGTGNVPQTQEKIDHYLSAAKPKLTKLVQAYISKIKKT